VLGTSLLCRSTVACTYLKVKFVKCLCLLPLVLVLVLLFWLFWSWSWSWSCKQRSWSWSWTCYFGLGLKNSVFVYTTTTPHPKGRGPGARKFLHLLHTPTLRRSNQILHGDQTGREENFVGSTTSPLASPGQNLCDTERDADERSVCGS